MRVRIAVDAMGGDFAPEQIVLGALQAAPLVDGPINLVGDPARIDACLKHPVPSNINIHPASQVIEMDDKPTEALRKKKDSSLAVCIELVKSGAADAVIAAGNTGAATAASLLSWRQIPGVHRPAIASPFPGRYGNFVLLDAGASPDVEPEHLVEFARMGRVYAQYAMGRDNPTVHLINIGEEETKGNSFAKQAHALLKPYPWFAGNIEGKDLFREKVDVVVCDAFVGNIVLKTAEGVGEYLMHSIREALPENKILQIPYLPLRKLLAPLRKKMDYAEYGGSPLLGLNGLTFICHGRSNAKAIKNAILAAQVAVQMRVLDHMRENFAQS